MASLTGQAVGGRLHVQEGVCDRPSAPSVSSISRVLRGRSRSDGVPDHLLLDDGVKRDESMTATRGSVANSKHTIDGILADKREGKRHPHCKRCCKGVSWVLLKGVCFFITPYVQ